MRNSEKRMAIFVQVLLALTLACISVCKAGEKEESHWAVAMEIEQRADRVERQSVYEKDSVEETLTERKRRSLSQSDRTDSQTMMNNLRRTVGSSNMPYLTYDVDSESDAASWTSFCNFDRTVDAPTVDGWQYLTTTSMTIPAVIKKLYQSFHREMSSVYLTSFGCDMRRCTTATYQGYTYQNALLTLCLFQGNKGAYDKTVVQYKLGEACTDCNSGSFWCDYGLCRGDCGPSDSCYCNSYCRNCASTDQATCTCQCLQGWSGTRCDTQSSDDAETPICSTTAHSPRMLTTISVNSAVPIGASFLQIVLCVVVVLFVRA